MADKELELLSSKIETGVKAAIAAAIERHLKLGQSISIMQDGKVVTLNADEILEIQNQQNNTNK
jgi:ABC-type proline/glycine betaine transport system ATPase subunit